MENIDPAEFAIEFETNDPATADAIREAFKNEEVLSSSSFDGKIILLIISSAPILLKFAYQFYAKHRETVKGGKIIIDKKKVSLEGFSANEINEIVEKGSIKKIQEGLI